MTKVEKGDTQMFVRLGFTGTRAGMSPAQISQLKRLIGLYLKIAEFHHGVADGSDVQSADLVKLIAPLAKIVEHPPKTLNAKALLARNKEIVAACDILIAAPRTDCEELRSGTWATIRYARAAGKSVIMLSR